MDSTTKKLTGLDTITSTLNRGSTGDQVKALQQYLIGLGYNNVKPDGVYGPITEYAVKQFQADNGLTTDGFFGSKSLGTAKNIGTTSNVSGKAGSGNILPTNQAEADALDAKLKAATHNHPAFTGNSKESLDNAMATGDFSGIYDQDGKPFSTSAQNAALTQANEALAPGYNIEKQKYTADTESTMDQYQTDMNKWNADQASQFQTDKTALDQNAANNGVLFSGGRAQKESKLGNEYTDNQAYKLSDYASKLGNVARDYQYNYGDQAAGNLSKHYNIGSNTYNPNVATGGVNPGSISSVYSPSRNAGYQGRKSVENTAAAQARAAGLLWNKGNKLMSSGLKNSYNS